jgi:alpha-beta hydrolase superfamily lysophospholipase
MRLSAGREPVEEWSPWRGADIHLDRYAVPEAPLTVIVLHGVGGNGRLLAPLGLMLQEHGYEAVIPDLPGYGLSVVSSDQIALDRWVDCVADLAEAEARRTGRRVVLFGMSLGGMLGYMAAAQGRRAAGVIATTLLDLRLPIAREQGARTPVLARLLTRLLPPLAAVFGGLSLPIRWFTKMGRIANDPEVARLVCEDSVGGGSKVPLRFLRSLLAFRPAIEPEGFDLCPLLLAHPAADRWTTIEASRPFFDRIRGPKELVMLENCGHFPIEEPGVSRLEEAVVGFLGRLSRVEGAPPSAPSR